MASQKHLVVLKATKDLSQSPGNESITLCISLWFSMRIGFPINHLYGHPGPSALLLGFKMMPQTEILTVMVNEVEIAFYPSALCLDLPLVLTGQDTALDTGDKKVY